MDRNAHNVPLPLLFSMVAAVTAFGVLACSGPVRDETSGAEAANPAHDEGAAGMTSNPGERVEADPPEPTRGAGEATGRREGEHGRGGREAEGGGSEGEHGAREAGGGEHGGREAGGGGEHGGRAGAEHGGAEGHGEGGSEGEESGEYLRRGETWDRTRRGARLTLSFDASRNAFRGTVANTTQARLCAVRVEVHLSTGTELGPTERTDLAPGESAAVELATAGEEFTAWTAHPEISACDR